MSYHPSHRMPPPQERWPRATPPAGWPSYRDDEDHRDGERADSRYAADRQDAYAATAGYRHQAGSPAASGPGDRAYQSALATDTFPPARNGYGSAVGYGPADGYGDARDRYGSANDGYDWTTDGDGDGYDGYGGGNGYDGNGGGNRGSGYSAAGSGYGASGYGAAGSGYGASGYGAAGSGYGASGYGAAGSDNGYGGAGGRDRYGTGGHPGGGYAGGIKGYAADDFAEAADGYGGTRNGYAATGTVGGYPSAADGYADAGDSFAGTVDRYSRTESGYDQSADEYVSDASGYDWSDNGYGSTPDGYAGTPDGYAVTPDGYAGAGDDFPGSSAYLGPGSYIEPGLSDPRLMAPDAGVDPYRWQADQDARREAGRRGLVVGAVTGFLAAAVAIGVSTLAAGFLRPQASPMAALDSVFIDRTPAVLKNVALQHFGTNGRTVLLLGMYAAIAVLAVGIGLLARRSAASGVACLAAFSLLAAFVTITRPGGRVSDVAAAVIGGIAGIAALLWLMRASAPIAPPLRHARGGTRRRAR